MITLDVVYSCGLCITVDCGCRERICISFYLYVWPLRISNSGKAGKFLRIICVSLVLFWPRLACNLRYVQTITTTTTTWWNHELVRSSDSNPTSSPSIQTSYNSSLYHASESTMVQKISVENVILHVLHNLDIIIVQYGNGQFCNITTRFMVSANNTESGGFSSHCMYLNL